MIVEISRTLSLLSPQWAFILSNGKIIETTLEDKSLSKMIRILNAIIHEIEVGNIIKVKELIIFRITFNCFIFLIGNIEKKELKKEFSKINAMFKERLINDYDNKRKTKKIDINLILFSMALEEGPTPINYLPTDYNDDLLFKVSMKSMLLLSVESEGAAKEMLSFQPYIDLDSLGIVYSFQIEDEKARGGAYDSALTILVDYKFRAVIYENYKIIESLINKTKKELIREYYTSKNYKQILNKLKNNLKNISFATIENEDLKSEMMEQIKKLAKL
ncbi:MAG: hypothetical protein ACTSQJ_04295 [Promethearchaeota archaeon]